MSDTEKENISTEEAETEAIEETKSGVKICLDCNGTGHIEDIEKTDFSISASKKPCPKCEGKGYIITDPDLFNEPELEAVEKFYNLSKEMDDEIKKLPEESAEAIKKWNKAISKTATTLKSAYFKILSEYNKARKSLNEEKNKLIKSEDKYLRLLAEYDNFRKRSIQEKLNASSDATARAALEVISVIDNFERAVAAECSDENYKKGVEMIYGQFVEVIKKLGVEEIDALGKEFDPNLHNAVSQVEDENFGENTVSQVYQKGYKLGDKVIRCAMVVVANP